MLYNQTHSMLDCHKLPALLNLGFSTGSGVNFNLCLKKKKQRIEKFALKLLTNFK